MHFEHLLLPVHAFFPVHRLFPPGSLSLNAAMQQSLDIGCGGIPNARGNLQATTRPQCLETHVSEPTNRLTIALSSMGL